MCVTGGNDLMTVQKDSIWDGVRTTGIERSNFVKGKAADDDRFPNPRLDERKPRNDKINNDQDR